MKQKEIRQAFRAADQIGAGLLDTEGVLEALKELEVPVNSKTQVDTLVNSLGKEGYIDMDGFKEVVDELLKGDEEAAQQFHHVFEILSNHTGHITLDSLQTVSQREGFSLQELKEMLNEADTNHDGRIDRLEFERVWKRAGMS